MTMHLKHIKFNTENNERLCVYVSFVWSKGYLTSVLCLVSCVSESFPILTLNKHFVLILHTSVTLCTQLSVVLFKNSIVPFQCNNAKYIYQRINMSFFKFLALVVNECIKKWHTEMSIPFINIFLKRTAQ